MLVLTVHDIYEIDKQKISMLRFIQLFHTSEIFDIFLHKLHNTQTDRLQTLIKMYIYFKVK